jgi:lipopolysaccharide biosynthesis protein
LTVTTGNETRGHADKQSEVDCRLIAIVLPQFHPIPQNDKWWGKGFTEWTNVAKAKPLFKGHYQPHLPGELGFYDLRLPEVRAHQAALASEHGIGGFCYYHYWFNGQRLLERPINDILSSGEPRLPFCLCWANENWTRAWDGGEREALMTQRYSQEDDLQHIRALLPFFADSRYIRINGKPLFIVYKANQLPEPQRTFSTWRQEAMRSGIGDIHLAQFEWGGSGTGTDPRAMGLDLSIEFSPDWRNLGGRYYTTRKAKAAIALGLIPRAYMEHKICDYDDMIKKMLSKSVPDYPFLRCVTPGFDNSARRSKQATVLLNSTPKAYGKWLHKSIEWTLEQHQSDQRIVFINAWNEWAEGNHLEPDAQHGRAYLEATRDALQQALTR